MRFIGSPKSWRSFFIRPWKTLPWILFLIRESMPEAIDTGYKTICSHRSYDPGRAFICPAAGSVRDLQNPGFLRCGGVDGDHQTGLPRYLKPVFRMGAPWSWPTRSRGTPRVANRLLKRVRDFAQVRHQGEVTALGVRQALELEGIDSLGLTRLDRRLPENHYQFLSRGARGD